jgi:phosphoserine phosphatase
MREARMRTAEIKTAIIYDFDGTLAPGNMQEHSFINDLGITKENFWQRVKKTAGEQDADEILIYMKLMIDLADDKKIKVTKDALRNHGKKIKLYKGLTDGSWFRRINKFAKSINLDLEHYIISSGNREIVEGCKIFKEFKHVFASQFIFDNDVAIWPGVAINYTTKTQYLFRINKGILNSWDNQKINEYTPEKDRPIPLQRMIFIGDGATDIPSMKMVAYQKGYSIAVYDPEKQAKDLIKIHKLISQDRASFIAEANYMENSQLDILIRGILERISSKSRENA